MVDHAPRCAAAEAGPLLCIYIVEPGLWREPDATRQHDHFRFERLCNLYRTLRALGGQRHVLADEVVATLDRLHVAAPFAVLHPHEETGNGFTFRRDRAVARWCHEHHVRGVESPQFGVFRRLADRNTWQARWNAFVAAPQWPTPPRPTPATFRSPVAMDRPSAARRRCPGSPRRSAPLRQHGDRDAALAVLADFLDARSHQCRGGISSPLSAPTACARLSAYLALGCAGRSGLTAFTSRLYRHCHFIRKLESEPALKFHNLHRGYDGLREDNWNPQHFAALVAGRTGWPLVDAWVAMLRDTGWINFRMRAMLVSVAAYPLWLHWRPVGLWLARQFLNYAPGIHWPQVQRQSGTASICRVSTTPRPRPQRPLCAPLATGGAPGARLLAVRAVADAGRTATTPRHGLAATASGPGARPQDCQAAPVRAARPAGSHT